MSAPVCKRFKKKWYCVELLVYLGMYYECKDTINTADDKYHLPLESVQTEWIYLLRCFSPGFGQLPGK